MIPLDRNRLFSELPPEEARWLQEAVQIRRYPAGAVVFREGDEGDAVYFVLSGTVQISAVLGEGTRHVLAHIAPGDFFGEMAVVDSQPRSATATAESEVELGVIGRDCLLERLERSPRLGISLVREVSRRLRDFDRQYIREALQAERLTLVGRFARSIVHDFKNPLSIIGVSADLAALDNANIEQRRQSRDHIRKQVDRLCGMINELLEFTRGSQGSAVLAKLDYAAFLEHLVPDLRAEVGLRNVTIEVLTPLPQVAVMLDPRRLTHVFFNLAHNAVDAMAPEGGKIMLRFSTTATEVTTELEDTGRGIAPEIAPRLFQAFVTYGKAQGTGLGLSICKRIIEDHGGRIGARSEPGRGALFSFTLPAR
ncbi:MAG: cyclic nucleotide-binding domain-containing protein [Verrucomicrobia bacterium]|nr:cyclic nucleotide-binding domain-containing protein [Verrucomicrobiota bacterium]